MREFETVRRLPESEARPGQDEFGAVSRLAFRTSLLLLLDDLSTNIKGDEGRLEEEDAQERRRATDDEKSIGGRAAKYSRRATIGVARRRTTVTKSQRVGRSLAGWSRQGAMISSAPPQSPRARSPPKRPA